VIEPVVEFALKQRFLVAVLAVVVIGVGLKVGLNLPVAAFPDVTNVQVQINTEARGLAAVEVEKLVSFPIESVMNGLPKVAEVRSLSKTGLSVVTVVFEDDVDTYFARNLVLERLQIARERIPDDLAEPQIGPVTTGLGQIYRYTVEHGGQGEGVSPQDLRSINDWIVKPVLRTVPGVADVLSFGGEVRQYQVQIDPYKLLKYDLTIDDVGERIRRSNRNAGGWYLEQGAEQLVIRGVGFIRGGDDGLADLAQIIVKHEDATPVHLKDVAEIEYGAEIRQGAVTRDGKGEVVSGIVLQLAGANTKDVIERVKEKLAELRLPAGIRLVAFYDQADLVNRAIETVSKALEESAVLIVVLLFLFLWNLRSTLVVLLSIPISILIAFIMMDRQGLSANLQSLGGLAIGIGMMVDGSIVMVENIVRHLAETNPPPGERLATVTRAAREVGRPVFFAVIIIVVVFLPLFTLQGVEGKLFSPMAFTIGFAMLGSLLIALLLVPALAFWFLRGRISEHESFLVRAVKRLYEPILRGAVARPGRVVAIAAIFLAGTLALVPHLGTEFVPQLEEGTLLMRVTMNPSISLDEAVRISSRLEAMVVKHPEVSYAISSIGRAELGGAPEGVSNNEIMIGLKPEAIHLRKELAETLDEEIGKVPGILLNFSQPIATRVDELLSGVKAEVAVKLFGDDLDVLAKKGAEIESLVRSIPGATDVALEQVGGETQLVVKADRDAVARRGLNVADCMDLVSTAVGGETVGQVLDGDRRYDIYMRLDAAHRGSAEQIQALLLKTPSGARVPLAQVASVLPEEGPPVVNREHARRRVVVQCNVRGRDLGGFVEEGRRLLERKVAASLPPGYSIQWGGQFENQQRAQRTLSIVVPLAILMIFMLLVMSFGSARSAALIILNVPFSLIGGVFALWVSGQYLSVPSSIGFIAVFGVAVLNGVVLVAYIRQLRSEGMPVAEAVVKGALLRIRPVLMTALVAILGLVPLVLSHGIGSEVQRPLASVVIGGIVTSTLLTLIVLPAIFRWFDGQRTEVAL